MDEVKHDLLMHLETGWIGTDIEGCPRCDTDRARFQDKAAARYAGMIERPSPRFTEAMEAHVLNHHALTLPDCQPCAENKHTECQPLLTQGNVSTICGCFATHPESDEHTEALFWLGYHGTEARENHETYGQDAT